jgi:hypothetical protein
MGPGGDAPRREEAVRRLRPIKELHRKRLSLIEAGQLEAPTKNAPKKGVGEVELGTGLGAVQAEKLLPQPQVPEALGLSKTNPRPMISSRKLIVTPLR